MASYRYFQVSQTNLLDKHNKTYSNIFISPFLKEWSPIFPHMNILKKQRTILIFPTEAFIIF